MGFESEACGSQIIIQSGSWSSAHIPSKKQLCFCQLYIFYRFWF